MAVAAKRPCAHPGCAQLTTAQYCEAHKKTEQKRYDTQRGNAAQRGYDSAWTKVRAQKLRDNPLCEVCESKGKVTPATRVHHIDRNSRNNAPSNLLSVCKSCHEAEHKDERLGRSRRL